LLLWIPAFRRMSAGQKHAGMTFRRFLDIKNKDLLANTIGMPVHNLNSTCHSDMLLHSSQSPVDIL